jgi:hypothetical protein
MAPLSLLLVEGAIFLHTSSSVENGEWGERFSSVLMYAVHDGYIAILIHPFSKILDEFY